MSKNTLNFIDLFSGCGGFSCGLEMAGLNCLLGVDFNKDAIATFAANHPNSKTYLGDIRKLTPKRFKELVDPSQVDIVIGGPPCQGFSTVGRGVVRDERNRLFQEFVRIVKLCSPKVLIFENVTGILAQKNTPILKAIFKSFEKLGYTMEARVLSSEEYGVPSVRRRTILIGTQEGIAPIFPSITHGTRGERPVVSVGDAFAQLKGQLLNHSTDDAKIKKTLDADRLRCIPEGEGIRYKEDQENFLPRDLWMDVEWESLPEGRFRQKKYFRISRNKPSPTILTSKTSYFHPFEHRYLTPREAAACQSFPNNFVFKGTSTSQFRQIGNAVPPLLGKALGESIIQMLQQKKRKAKTKSQLKAKIHAKNAFNYAHQVGNSATP